jgi:predicted dehydrogenase
MVGVAIVGTNWGGNVQTPIFRAAGLNVVAIYSRSLKKAEKVAKNLRIKHAFDSVEKMCECPDVDVVSITSPTHLHVQHALIALRAGKHVLSDKPAGANVPEVEELARESKQRPNQIAIIDHEMRFTSSVLAARKAVFQDKIIGELRHFDMQMMMNFFSFGKNHVWWNEKEKGGGILGAAGVHYIDMLHFITGQKITAVNAMTETFVKEKRMHPKSWKTEADKTRLIPCTAEEYFCAQFRCDDGALGSLNVSGVMAGQGGGTTFFNGTKGSAKLTSDTFTVFDLSGKVITETKDGRVPEALRKVAGDHAGAPALGTFNIATAIKHRLENTPNGEKCYDLDHACTISEGLYNQRVIEAIHVSNERAHQCRL